MTAVLRAVDDARLSPTIIYPNTDRGHTGVLQAIEVRRHQNARRRMQVVKSLNRDEYLRVLMEADVLVGNSSSGLIEAPTAGTASVNVGPRQQGREPGGSSVLNADENFTSIRNAIRLALRKRPRIGCPSVYGNGPVGPKIATILSRVSLDEAFRRKLNRY